LDRPKSLVPRAWMPFVSKTYPVRLGRRIAGPVIRRATSAPPERASLALQRSAHVPCALGTQSGRQMILLSGGPLPRWAARDGSRRGSSGELRGSSADLRGPSADLRESSPEVGGSSADLRLNADGRRLTASPSLRVSASPCLRGASFPRPIRRSPLAAPPPFSTHNS
jgi:hypothetical protein